MTNRGSRREFLPRPGEPGASVRAAGIQNGARTVRSGGLTDDATPELTHVELLWIRQRVENRIRFGRTEQVHVVDRYLRVVSFTAGSIFAFNTELEKVHFPGAEECYYERWSGRLRRANEEIHLRRREAERASRHLVDGVVFVRVEHSGTILAVDCDHVEESGLRHFYFQHDLLADLNRLPTRGGDLQRLPCAGQSH